MASRSGRGLNYRTTPLEPIIDYDRKPNSLMEPSRTIRVLVVDDSSFMRQTISSILNNADGIEVVDSARDGIEALQKVATLRPDVVTMDIEMPRMDGITALRRIMATRPVPVVMVSSMTQEGATATLEALEAGALDFIPKNSTSPGTSFEGIRSILVEKIRAVAGRSLPRLSKAAPVRKIVSLAEMQVLAVGSSTGGPFALQQIIPRLSRDFPLPIIVAQHMPPRFTGSLAARLDAQSELHVKEAESGDELRPGRVLIAPGGRHLILVRHGDRVEGFTPAQPDTLHKPSVDVMLDAACDVFDGKVASLILTGMGRDGRDGSRRVREQGGVVMAQDAETSVVYGMPRGVIEAELADAVLPLQDIAGTLMAGTRRNRLGAAVSS